MTEEMRVNDGQETETIQEGVESPYCLALRIQSLADALLAMAEKDDLPGKYSDLLELLMKDAEALEGELEDWKAAPAPEADRELH